MTFSALVVADSVSSGVRLTTLQLRYPRFIHAEFMTHRVFSRNASSSRAIPVKRLIEDVLRDPAMPIHWGKNQPGMQARAKLDEELAYQARANWMYACHDAVHRASELEKIGAHKQIINRIIEPYAHINVVVTATEWANFFKLRLHPDAQPEIHELARVMKLALDESKPLTTDEHLPYVQPEERFGSTSFETLARLSAARCARTSYVTHENKEPNFEDDLKLADRLLTSEHMSPFEHAATATRPRVQCANFTGWISYRARLESPGVSILV